jgi:hypothetical protein
VVGGRRALVRTIALPAQSLERVLRRLAVLKRELGRGPHIARDGDGSATSSYARIASTR